MEVDTTETIIGAVPSGWTWKVKKRTRGKTAGKFDWYIFK